MATLKQHIDPALVRSLAADLARAWPDFDAKAFTARATRGLEALELTPRARHIAAALAAHLPPDFPRAAALLTRSLGPELDRTKDFGMAVFRYLPHVYWVAEHGLADDHFDAAMRFQHEITRRFSAEYSIRAYLAKHPERTFAQLAKWAKDPNVHVRRLVSEGTRPRLPWAGRLEALVADPSPSLPLLEALRDDPELYVRRSVANHLNDIGKDHPELLVDIASRWRRGASAARRQLIAHALRSLIKAGHPGALAVLGFGEAPRVKLEEARATPARVPAGGRASFSATLTSTARATQELVVDYVVHYVKASGGTSPKVFKLKTVTLPARGQVDLGFAIAFRDLSTRKHHPGRHVVQLRVNGKDFPLGAVLLG